MSENSYTIAFGSIHLIDRCMFAVTITVPGDGLADLHTIIETGHEISLFTHAEAKKYIDSYSKYRFSDWVMIPFDEYQVIKTMLM